MPVLNPVGPDHQSVRVEAAQLGHHLPAAEVADGRPVRARVAGQ